MTYDFKSFSQACTYLKQRHQTPPRIRDGPLEPQITGHLAQLVERTLRICEHILLPHLRPSYVALLHNSTSIPRPHIGTLALLGLQRAWLVSGSWTSRMIWNHLPPTLMCFPHVTMQHIFSVKCPAAGTIDILRIRGACSNGPSLLRFLEVAGTSYVSEDAIASKGRGGSTAGSHQVNLVSMRSCSLM